MNKNDDLQFDLTMLNVYMFTGYLYSTIKKAEEYIKKVEL